MAPLCMATPIVVDYSVIPKTTFNPSAISKQANSDKLFLQQTSNSPSTQQQNDVAPPMTISASAKEFQPNQESQSNEGFQPNNELLPTKSPQQDKEPLLPLAFNFNGFHQTLSLIPL